MTVPLWMITGRTSEGCWRDDLAQPDYMKYITFRPGADLKEQMERHWNDRGRSDSVRMATDYQCPDYDVMGAIPLSYYLFWRQELQSGRMQRGCRGYWFLRMAEMANMDMEPSEVRRECIMLTNEHRGHWPTDPWRFLVDYQLSHGGNFDFPWIFPKGDTGNMALAEVLSYPPGPFSRQFVARLMEDSLDDSSYADRITPLVNAALTAVGDLLHSKGTGILEEFGRGRILRQHTVFEEIPYFGECNYMVEFTDIDPNGKMGDFLDGIVRVAADRYLTEQGRPPLRIPSVITKEMRRIIDEYLEDIPAIDRGPKTHDAVITPMSEYMSGNDTRPVMLHDPSASDDAPDGRLPEWTREFRDMDDRICGYIPSGHRTPDYGMLKGGRLDYYIFWRNGVRDGRFGTTDRGYMWLMLCELVNDPDAKGAMETIMGLHRAYSVDDTECLIGKTAMFMADTNDLDIPHTSISDGSASIGRVMNQICNGRQGYIDRSSLEILARADGKNPIPDFDDACTEILNRSIPQIEQMVRSRNRATGGICGYYRLGPFKDVLTPPWGIPIGKGPRVRATVFNAFDVYFISDMRELMKAVVSARKGAVKGKPGKTGTKKLAGIQYAQVLSSVAEEVIGEMPQVTDGGPAKVTRRMIPDLDRDAVSDAERDLRSVTEMMAVDDDGPSLQEEREGSVVKVTGADPWGTFASSLSDVESEYLNGCLNGCITIDIRLEDSINAKSMDTVEDTVVSDGIVFDDYIDDIRRMFGDCDP